MSVNEELLLLLDAAVMAREGSRRGQEVLFICPAHDDHHPSARWKRKKAVWHCDACGAGGGAVDLAKRLGIEVPTSAKPGLSLAEIAEAKRLPPEFLSPLGVREGLSGVKRTPCVDIPYLDADGEVVAVRKRIALYGNMRFLWRPGDKTLLYGLWRMKNQRESESILLVEGESDAWTLWFAGISALGIPGANTWKEAWKAYVQDFATVYVWCEPDAGGDSLASRVAADLPDVRVIEPPPDCKDPNQLWLACDGDVGVFTERLSTLLAAARPASQLRIEALGKEARELLAKCRELLEAPDLLSRVQQAIRAGGYAGDLTAPTLVWIALISRHLERPLNIGVIAQSSAGKNRAVDDALALVQSEAYHLEKAGSARAVIYTERSFEHRMVVFAEADSIPSEGPAASAIRSLAADNLMTYDVVEKEPKSGQFVTRRIEKPGPTGLITTSTKPLEEQLSTRLLIISVPDTPDQTRAVLLAHAARVNGQLTERDISPFLALDRWLEIAGNHEVIVPFGTALASAVPADLVRMRRDFRQLLTVIQAVALLYQRQRERDEKGRVLANLDDYAVARGLLLDVFTSTASGGITDLVRKTVASVGKLQDGNRGVTVKAVGESMGVQRDTAWYRVQRALSLGLLVNLETARGRPAKLILGDSLPEEKPALPTVEALRELWVAHPETASTVQPQPPSTSVVESDPAVETPVETGIQPDFQPSLGAATDSDTDPGGDPVEWLNDLEDAVHTTLDVDRVYLLALAATCDFPTIKLTPWKSVSAGEAHWQAFAQRADIDDLNTALARLEELGDGPTANGN